VAEFVIVSSADIFAAEGSPLDAGYWSCRKPGEPVYSYRARNKIAAMNVRIRRARATIARAEEAIAAFRERVPPEFRDEETGSDSP